MKFWLSHEGHDTEVEFHTEGGRLWVEQEGRRLEADFRRLPDGEVYSLLIDGRSYEVGVNPAGQTLEVTVGGTMLAVDVRHPLEKLLQSIEHPGASTSGETVQAPMPGLVVAVRVATGDTVAAGQAVAVVEAMKMQNELTATVGGVVETIFVSERQTVESGAKLVRLKA